MNRLTAMISHRRVFIALMAVLFCLMPLLSRGFGVTWDEWMDSNNGMLVLRYLLSGGQDREFLNFWHGIYYSHLFYSLTGFAYGLFVHGAPAEFAREGLRNAGNLLGFYTFSHAMNALFGWLTILAAGMTLRRLAGWRAAWIGALLLFLSPRFLGHSMNNPKDIPFAATYMTALLFLIRLVQELPRISTRTAVFAGLAIGAAIGTRAGGFLLFFYLYLFVAAVWFLDRQHSRPWPLQPLIKPILIATVTGYFSGLIFWPYAQLNPLIHPLEALREFSKFAYWDNAVLFEGRLVKASLLPWYYLPKWILISVPHFALAGFFFFLFLIPHWKKYFNLRLVSMTAFGFFFPLFYVLISGSIVYDGWRHVLFLYPPLILLIALGWETVLRLAEANGKKWAAGLLFILLLIEPAGWMLRNHPHLYVYFNSLTGGLNGAFGRYETDYWGNCLRPAAEWLAAHHAEKNPNRFLTVRTDGSIMSSYPYLYEELNKAYHPFGFPADFVKENPFYSLNFPPYLEGPDGWDYALVLPRNWKPERLEENWPPEGTVHRVTAEDVTLCAVVKNPKSPLK